jgi:4-diphosphocytidyl-2-C-methyl-D-erythritol kinase
MSALRDTGWAKLNLTLEVLGRRPDGFHELNSLVAFAALGDELALEPGDGLELEIEGPFAGALAGDNLILKAARAASDRMPELTLGRFQLIKLLPVAAGLGGGSADAAAALRLIARAKPGGLTETKLAELAAEIGSDVSVCLASRPALITGRGESVAPAHGVPSFGVLLANPGLPLATEAVYAALRAEAFAPPPRHDADRLDFHGDFESLIDYVRPRGNDLEPPAAHLVPEIRAVLAALLPVRGVRLARLSGSGPTCFALFSTEAEAKRAAAELAGEHPNWWIAASSVRT